MVDKKLLVVDRELLEAIDEKRGTLSRTEFVEACINASLGKARSGPETPSRKPVGSAPVTREELRDLQDRVAPALAQRREMGQSLEALKRRFQDTLDVEEPETRRSSGHSGVWSATREETGDHPPHPRLPSPEASYPRRAGMPSRGDRTSREERPPEDLRQIGGERPYLKDRPREDPLRARDVEYRSEESYGRGSRQARGEELYYDEPQVARRISRYEETRVERRSSAPRGPQPLKAEGPYLEESRFASQQVQKGGKEAALQLKETDTAAGASKNMYPALWFPAIALFGFGDTLTSTMVFAKGGFEANPLMGGLVSLFGGNIIAFVLVKTLILAVLALVSFKMVKSHGWIIPGALSLVGAYLVFSNLMALVGM